MSYVGRVNQKSSDIRRFDVTSSTSATHTLTWVAPNEQSLIVTINGVKQQEDAYSVSGTTLTLTDALIVTDKLEVIGINDLGTTITPAQNSITNDMVSSTAAIAQSKLATLAIDTSEIADDAVTADKLANSINTEIAANTAKVTNATHTGDVTGATALTIAADAVDIAMLSATGTASATTYLRGDNAWSAIATPLLTSDYASVQRITTSFSGDADPVTGYTNVDVFDPNTYGSMAVSSGIFTFPTTGIYKIEICAWADKTGSTGDVTCYFIIYTSTDDFSSEDTGTYTQFAGNTTNYTNQGICYDFCYFDVTNVSTHKCRLVYGQSASGTNVRIRCGATSNNSYMGFTRLGDT